MDNKQYNNKNNNCNLKNSNNKYSDIINLPHHISNKHPQMSIEARAAQFGAFAALEGYEDELKETERCASMGIERDEEN